MAGAIVHSYNPHKDVVVARINAAGQVGAAKAQAAGQAAAAAAQAAAAKYGAWAGGLGSFGQSAANEAGARTAASGMVEAARQGALGNIGSAALGAYGSAANSALGAWAANQTAYNRSLADMHVADQQGLSQYGSTRNAALSGLGNSYSGMLGPLMAANALSNLSFDMSGTPGGNFSVTGNKNSTSNTGGSPWKVDPEAFAPIDTLRENLMSPDVMNRMAGQSSKASQRLDDQHAASRYMPSTMLADTVPVLQNLYRSAADDSSSGVNQFYEMNPAMTGLGRYQALLDVLLEKDKPNYAHGTSWIRPQATTQEGRPSVVPPTQPLWDAEAEMAKWK
jgi:hypothetical protein